MITRLRLHFILVLICSTPFIAVADETPELPFASALLVEKLEKYSVDLRSETEAKIAAKRDMVIEVLEKHLEERTKAGDLDGAVAIRDLLKKWREESRAAESATSATVDEEPETAWKTLIGEGAEPLEGWMYQKDAPIQVKDGVVTISSKGGSYTPLYQPTAKDNAVIGLSVKVGHDRSVEKEQQAGIGFQLASREGDKEIGHISCVIQGPEANLLYGEIGDGDGEVLRMEKNTAGIDRLSEMQFAFVDGHFLVFSKKRKLHDFYDPRLKDAVAVNVILFGNNSEAQFENIRSLVPDAAQVERLLSGKPVE